MLVDYHHEKHHLTLTDTERTTLEGLLTKGTLLVKTFKRATALLELDCGKTLTDVAATLSVTYSAVANWRERYKATGLKCLDDAPRSGRPPSIDGLQSAKITALACSDAPEGYDRWTLRLLAEKAVEAGICEQISHSAVADILKKRTQAAPQANLVSEQNRRGLSSAARTDPRAVCADL